MAIPQYNELYRDFLDALADEKIHALSEIRNAIALKRSLSPDDLEQLLPSGKDNAFKNRVSWTGVYLNKAGLVNRPARGKYEITQEGKRLQNDQTIHIDNSFLLRYPTFRTFIHKDPSEGMPLDRPIEPDDPTTAINDAFFKINQALADDLMQEIMKQDFVFFEHLVVSLLQKMGYGGPFEDSGIVTKATGDEGIDGIIKEDKLGFDQIYIQAKRWDPNATVSRPEIDKFSGALHYRGVSKGLFITTAKFSKGAIDAAERQHIVLIDGETLTKMMIEYNVGVSVEKIFYYKKLDENFFNDENGV